ncbi:cyclic nucleotide-binding domain-containing protein [Pseudoxanthobacter sp.]|uniref:cyclic nucleotide-binding domain-containing protein n=1 Tax=Pseudoxanthobacter sp. TaxID=1925742 RepID=UPI002FE2BFFA
MSLQVEVEALRRVPLFRGVDPSRLRLLAFISERISFQDGEYLCRQGERGNTAYILLSGAADVVLESAGGARRLAHLHSNDIVGEISILIDVPRTASVIAAGEVTALAISKDNFLKMLTRFPEMSLEVMRVLAHRLERTTRDLAQAGGQAQR